MDNETMLALTIWQPFASAIIAGHKTLEWRNNRTRQLKFAIHAGKRSHIEAQRTLQREIVDWPDLDNLPRGVLGIVEIVLIHEIDQDYCPINHLDYLLGYRESLYAWELKVVEVFDPPVAANGMPGFWTWTRPGG